MSKTDHRPVFLDLTKISLPVTAITSIMHRLTGVVLFFSVPLLLGLIHYSMFGLENFNYIVQLLHAKSWWVQLISVLIVFCVSFHLICGIKHLLTDLGLGTGLSKSRKKSWVVIILTLVITLLVLFNYII